MTVSIRSAIAILFLVVALRARAQWQTDYSQALGQAKQEGKPVLINFTGSDWCGPCIEMHKRVFSDKTFLDYAGKHLILVEIDYPKTKSLPEEVKQQNDR